MTSAADRPPEVAAVFGAFGKHLTDYVTGNVIKTKSSDDVHGKIGRDKLSTQSQN